MFAHRSIYHDGWRAVCPLPGTSFKESGSFFGAITLTEDMLRELDAKNWELYDLSKDPTETTDLAASNRPKLIEMIALWYTEAGKYNVFPLDSRGTMRFADERPELTKARQTYVYYPGTQMIPENVAAKLLNKSHSLTADVEIPKGGAEGVLICHGGNVGGYTLFVKDKKLHYVHNYVGAEEFHVVSNADVPEGKVSLRLRVREDRRARLQDRQGRRRQGAALHQQEARRRDDAALHGAARARDRQRRLHRPQFRLAGERALWAAVRVHGHDPSGDGGRFRQADRGQRGTKARGREDGDGAAVRRAMADTPFPPLKREPLLEEELPAANPTVRLIKGARIKFAPGQPTGLHRHPISTVGVVTAGSFHLQLEGKPVQLLKTGDSFFEPAGHTILKFDNASTSEPAEIVCFYLADTKERPPIEMLAGGMDSQLGKVAHLRRKLRIAQRCAGLRIRSRPALDASSMAPTAATRSGAARYRLDWMWLRSTG